MSKFAILFSQSYFSKLKAKSFIITTLIFLLAILALFMWPTISSWFSSNDRPLKIEIVDRTGLNAGLLMKGNSKIKYSLFSGSLAQSDQAVKDKKADGVLLLTAANGVQLQAQMRTASGALTLNDQQLIGQQLQTANQLFTIQGLKLSPEQAQRILTAHISLEQKTINNESNGKSADHKTQAAFISYGIAFFIYLFVISYMSMISSEIAAEKDSRIMEIIISSSSPVAHLLSRTTAILALGFTQIFILFGSGLIMAYSFDGGKYWHLAGDAITVVSSSYLIFALLFFILACILYTLLGAVLGSLVSKVQDVGQAIMPVTMILMIGFFIAISGLGNPDTLLIKIFSYIPFTASMIMPMRIGATEMGIWEAVLSLVILAGTIVWLFQFSLKFYRGSVLTYTSGSFFKKMKQALSLSK
ncbi:ABC transporter permease [Sporolactobacillus shoreae]|uniref:ABC transporter permease n=1 Tax=Sporolactobacillus shoreae TaxID=1465501 RepID=A0A4Z0GM96_9BACL|nr:ABC transporter permease [Sporolactobacillus shoreae]TGA97632.1 ABC transporter permease [Sporolactobacillus shoreae]